MLRLTIRRLGSNVAPTSTEKVAHGLVEGVSPAALRAVAAWIFGVAAIVYVMVVVGGVTRLTRSGLSMVDWRPQGSWLPENDKAW